MGRIRDLIGVYSASLKAENIIEAIGMTAPDKLDIGAIQLVNIEDEYLSVNGIQKIKEALKTANTKVAGIGTGSPGIWVFDQSRTDRLRLAADSAGLFSYEDKPNPQFALLYKLGQIRKCIDAAVALGEVGFVSFHAGELTGKYGEEIKRNLLVIGDYCKRVGVYIALERGLDTSTELIKTIRRLNKTLGKPIFGINNDTANPYIWGAAEDSFAGSRRLKGAGIIYGYHIKAAKKSASAAPSDWKAEEVPLFKEGSVDLKKEIELARGILSPDTKQQIFLVNETEYGSEEERLNIIRKNIEVMVEIMKKVGY